MAKKREADAMDSDEDIDIDVENPEPTIDLAKKHKKHKKHKHNKKKRAGSPTTQSTGPGISADPSMQDPEPSATGDGIPNKPAIKLKLKIGGKTLSTKSVSKKQIHNKTPSPSDESLDSSKGKASSSSTPISFGSKTWEAGTDKRIKTKRSGDDTSDEEKEWLDALERGTLDESGGVAKQKDPKLLTARQRALIHGPSEADDTLLQLPTQYKNTELTEEQLQRRQQRAKKRREQAQEKREKDKKQTLERLLKKQEAKMKGAKGRSSKRGQVPSFRYINNASVTSISVPVNFQFPFQAKQPTMAKPLAKCGMQGCTNDKKYSCSKTGVPLCSLQCYKKNLDLNSNVTPVC